MFQFIERDLLAHQVGQFQLQAALDGMGVRIEHARHQHLATQVDDAGGGGLQAQHGLVGSHGNDLLSSTATACCSGWPGSAV